MRSPPIWQPEDFHQGQIEEVLAACHASRRHLQEDIRPLTGVRTTLAAAA